jgi:hypothetical protein
MHERSSATYLWGNELSHSVCPKRSGGEPKITVKSVNLMLYCPVRTMYERSSATYLWAAMTHLTPSALDILVNPGGGIRDLNTKIARKAIFLNGHGCQGT